jgi:hypothetical protein
MRKLVVIKDSTRLEYDHNVFSPTALPGFQLHWQYILISREFAKRPRCACQCLALRDFNGGKLK